MDEYIEDEHIERQRREEFKATILILIWVFLIVGVGLGLLFKEYVITWTSGLTCFVIGMWRWIKIEYG